MKNRTYKHGVFYHDKTGECVFDCGGNSKLGHAGGCDALTLRESYDKQTEWVRFFCYRLCRVILAVHGRYGGDELKEEIEKAIKAVGADFDGGLGWVKSLVSEYEENHEVSLRV